MQLAPFTGTTWKTDLCSGGRRLRNVWVLGGPGFPSKDGTILSTSCSKPLLSPFFPSSKKQLPLSTSVLSSSFLTSLGTCTVFPFSQDWARIRRIRLEVDRAGPEYCGTWNGSFHPISLCFLKYNAKVSMTTSRTQRRTKEANIPIFKCAFCLSLRGL